MSTLIVKTNGVTKFTVTKREREGFCTATLAEMVDLLTYGCAAFKEEEGEYPANREDYIAAFDIALKAKSDTYDYYYPLRYVIVKNNDMEDEQPLYIETTTNGINLTSLFYVPGRKVQEVLRSKELKVLSDEKIKLFDGPTNLVKRIEELVDVKFSQEDDNFFRNGITGDIIVAKESSGQEPSVVEVCTVTGMPLYLNDIVYFYNGEVYADFKAIQNEWGINYRYYRLYCAGYNIAAEYESGNGEEMEEYFNMSDEEFDAWYEDHLDGWSIDYNNGCFPLTEDYL